MLSCMGQHLRPAHYHSGHTSNAFMYGATSKTSSLLSYHSGHTSNAFMYGATSKTSSSDIIRTAHQFIIVDIPLMLSCMGQHLRPAHCYHSGHTSNAFMMGQHGATSNDQLIVIIVDIPLMHLRPAHCYHGGHTNI